jgi:hypothetical protein
MLSYPSALESWIGKRIRVDTVEDSYWVGLLRGYTERGDLLLLMGEEEEGMETWIAGAAVVAVRQAIPADEEEDDDTES